MGDWGVLIGCRSFALRDRLEGWLLGFLVFALPVRLGSLLPRIGSQGRDHDTLVLIISPVGFLLARSHSRFCSRIRIRVPNGNLERGGDGAFDGKVVPRGIFW